VDKIDSAQAYSQREKEGVVAARVYVVLHVGTHGYQF
jgi:hypothetical protein